MMSHDGEAYKVTFVIWDIRILTGETRLVVQNAFAHIHIIYMYIILTYNLHTPPKTNLGPRQHRFEKEIHLPNLCVWVPC